MCAESQLLQDASKYIQNWIARQPAVKEESLTDWLLFYVSSRIPRFRYVAFSRHTEARETGADWEWWLLFRDTFFRLRVQAKKLVPKTDAYPGIAHTNRYGLQIDMLLSGADKANAIPFYAFYTGTPSRSMCGGGRDDEGVYLGGARRISTDFLQAGRKVVLPDDVLKRTTPLSCILACPLVGKHGSLLHFLESYHSEDLNAPISAEGEPNDTPRGVYTQLPPFVTSFLQSAAEGLPDWWEAEFGHNVQDIKALAVYDLRDTHA